MYAQHFNFTDLPFSIAPNPRYVYLSPQHREALAHLLYGISMGGGFVVLTGEVGTGKTTLCRCLLESVPDDVEIAVIFNPRLNSRELLAAICDELRIPHPQQRNSLKLLIDLLNHHLLEVHARGKRTVVLIDEAQNLSFDVLEQIRLLTNLETNETKLLQIILVGQPELNNLLRRRNLRQLSQRITARYHLRPLSFRETVAYIKHRITVSGGKNKVFGWLATALVYRLSSGIPRVINLICDRALLGAYTLGKTQVNYSIVRKAAAEVLADHAAGSHRYVRPSIGAAGVLALVSAAVYFHNGSIHSNAITKKSAGQSDPVAQSAIKEQRHSSNHLTVTKVITPAVPRIEPQPVFAEIVAGTDFTRNDAIASLFKLWHIASPATGENECSLAQQHGLRCLVLTGSWMQFRNLGIPAVLSFEMNGGSKRYAIFAAIEKEKVHLLLGERSYDFAPADILPYWRGEALLLWKPPFDNLQVIKPGDTGQSVKWLRQRLGATAPGNQELHFDAALQEKLMAFQKQHGLFADGIAGALTLIHLSRNAEQPIVADSSSNVPSIVK